MVIFQQADFDYTNIHAVTVTSDGRLGTSAVVSDRRAAAISAAVALDNSGRALAAWLQSSGAALQVFAAAYSPLSGWGAAQSISDTTLGAANPPVVALDSGGNGFVLWTQAANGGGLNLWARRYLAERGFTGLPERLSASTGVTALTPSAALDDSGRAFAAWIEAGTVWRARFE